MPGRRPLSRERVLRAAVAIADGKGLESLSMRTLARELGVVPTALYRHIASKEELVDGMVGLVIGMIDQSFSEADWRTAVRSWILSARHALLRHAWALGAIESRRNPAPALLAYLDSLIGVMRTNGFSVDLTRRAMHLLGSAMFGVAQDPLDVVAMLNRDSGEPSFAAMSTTYPFLAELTAHSSPGLQSPDSSAGEQLEFEIVLDLLLDGIEVLRLKEQDSSRPQPADP